MNVISRNQARAGLWPACTWFKKVDFDMFCKSLASVPWDLAEAEDIDTWWTQWKDLFLLQQMMLPGLLAEKQNESLVV